MSKKGFARYMEQRHREYLDYCREHGFPIDNTTTAVSKREKMQKEQERAALRKKARKEWAIKHGFAPDPAKQVEKPAKKYNKPTKKPSKGLHKSKY